MIKVLLIDNQKDFIDGLIHLFRNHQEIHISSWSAPVKDFLNNYEPNNYDIILMDIKMEISGLEIARKLLDQYPQQKVIMISMYHDFNLIYNIIGTGAKGFIPKNTSYKEISETITRVYHGGSYFAIPKSTHETIKLQEYDKIPVNDQDYRILKEITSQKSDEEIAENLNITTKKVTYYRNQYTHKFNLPSVESLTLYCLNRGII